MSYISIDVECISEEWCRNCPELEVEVCKETIFADDKAMCIVNSFYCAHKYMCKNLLERFEKVTELKNEQKEDKS